MMLMDLFVPKGTFSQEQRLRVSERLVSEVLGEGNARPEFVERARAMTYVAIHESEALVGGRLADTDEPPRYIVRLTVPAEHNTDGMRAETMARVTRVLAEVDDDPQLLYREPNTWVHMIEVPDGNMGAVGQVVRIGDIMRMIINPGSGPTESATATIEATDTLVDPICGMTVALTSAAITLVREGQTYAFCSAACRDLFVEQQPVSIP